uniref:Uncharacterized protein n=2 Tax=Aegilops tauschii subsp. strangulata TaxID=200361 RepID=A0A452ZE23_AEGTS
ASGRARRRQAEGRRGRRALQGADAGADRAGAAALQGPRRRAPASAGTCPPVSSPPRDTGMRAVAACVWSDSICRLQDAKEGLSAERARLGDLQRLLRTRQQSMVAQVAALYPVRVFRDLPVAQNHHSRTNGECRTPSEENGALPHENGNGTHLLSVIKSPHVGPLTFFGWQIGKPKTKQPSYSHKELQRSAAVLGYAAHSCLLPHILTFPSDILCALEDHDLMSVIVCLQLKHHPWLQQNIEASTALTQN